MLPVVTQSPWGHMSKQCFRIKMFLTFVAVAAREFSHRAQRFCLLRKLSDHLAHMLHFTGESSEASKMK